MTIISEEFPVKVIDDSRGSLFEILRNDNPIMCSDRQEDFMGGPIQQVYATTVLPGVVKAWHLHRKQWDRMVCVQGIVRFCFWPDFPKERWTIPLKGEIGFTRVVRAGRPKLIVIPPNVWHGFKNIGQEEATVINCPSELFNYDQPDEERKPIDAFKYFDWHASVDG